MNFSSNNNKMFLMIFLKKIKFIFVKVLKDVLEAENSNLLLLNYGILAN